MLLPLVAPHLTSPVPSGVHAEDRRGGVDTQTIMGQMERERQNNSSQPSNIYHHVSVMKGVLQAALEL